MPHAAMRVQQAFKSRLRTILAGPQVLAFLPAVTLAGYWMGGEDALIAIALVLPVVFGLAGLFTKEVGEVGGPRDPVTGLMLRDAAVSRTDILLAEGPTRSQTTAAFAVEIDEFGELEKRFGHRASDDILAIIAERIHATVRSEDLVARLDGPRFCVVLASGIRTDMESLIQTATRLQRAVEAACSIDGSRVFVTISVGFCSPRRAPTQSGDALVEAAEHALIDATATGSSAIRAFTHEMKTRARARNALADELPTALEKDQIRPWFQPQVDTIDGNLSGLEVLARWEHPVRGVISPADFLPIAESQGLMERLGEVILYHSLNAVRAWDAADLHVPKVSMNFSAEELRNPKIVNKIQWELDRFDLTPDRLSIEVLETVIAQTSNDTIIRNLRAFADLGSSIDLDDFGTGHASIANIKRFSVGRIKIDRSFTGHASIANIKRFSVGRIKIDRSFVTQLDTDLDQQNIVSAILTLAERLELDTLAEGVETPAEHALLAQLGCGHIQGYAIARPMPFDKVETWLHKHRTRSDGAMPATALADGPTGGGNTANPGKTA